LKVLAPAPNGELNYFQFADLEADIFGYDHDDEKSWRVM